MGHGRFPVTGLAYKKALGLLSPDIQPFDRLRTRGKWIEQTTDLRDGLSLSLNIKAYDSQLKEWMHRFIEVATRCLDVDMAPAALAFNWRGELRTRSRTLSLTMSAMVPDTEWRVKDTGQLKPVFQIEARVLTVGGNT